jgi:ornithine decarboxylase
MDEAIRYRIVTSHGGGETGPVVLAGPSCDSADILYEKTDFRLPLDLKAGDRVWILATGAYTTTYSAVNFNGFPPLTSVCI